MRVYSITTSIPSTVDLTEKCAIEIDLELHRFFADISCGDFAICARVFPSSKRGFNVKNVLANLSKAFTRCGVTYSANDLQVTRGNIVSGGRIEVLIGEIVHVQK